MSTDLTKAATDVLDERQRQIEQEGWTAEHDDKHRDCELAAAAACYATCNSDSYLELRYRGAQLWPGTWRGWFKGSSYRRNLVKAAALILAEIERLDRRDSA